MKKKSLIRKAKQERAQSTVDAILAAAAQILIGRGYAEVTTNRIADVAGVSIGSVYQYFKNKDAIVAELIERKLVREMEVFVRGLRQVADVDLAIGIPAVIRQLLGALRSDFKLRKVYEEQIPKVGKLGRLRTIEREAVVLVSEYLRSKRGELRVKDVEVAAYVSVQAVQRLIQNALHERPDLIESGILERELTELVLRYLAA